MATSKLQRLVGDKLDKAFPQFRIRENYRPEWMRSSELSKLELDFYIEDIKTAFEIQDAQHYQFVEFFHKTKDEFERRRKLDAEKFELCGGHDVRLIEIFTETDIIIAIKEIEDKYCQQPKYYYHDPTPGFDQRRKEVKKKRHNEIEVLKEKGLWVTRAERKNSPENFEEVQKRLQKCIENVRRYESGLLEAPEYKYMYWKQVVENNGICFED